MVLLPLVLHEVLADEVMSFLFYYYYLAEATGPILSAARTGTPVVGLSARGLGWE